MPKPKTFITLTVEFMVDRKLTAEDENTVTAALKQRLANAAENVAYDIGEQEDVDIELMEVT